MPLFRAMLQVLREEGVCALYRGAALMCTGNALAAAAFFGCFDSCRVYVARWIHQLLGQRLYAGQLQPGLEVTHDVLGGGTVVSRGSQQTIVHFENNMTYAFSDKSLAKCQFCLGGAQEYNRRFINQYVAPLSAGVFAGVAFVTVMHPFDRLRQWHAKQSSRSSSALCDFVRARKSPTILFRGWLGKLPGAVIVGLPLFFYSFTVARPGKEEVKCKT